MVPGNGTEGERPRLMWRTNHHPETREYLLRRRTEGRSDREIRRCLKRHLARRIFKLLQRVDNL